MSLPRPVQIDPLRQFDPRDTERFCDLISFPQREQTLEALALLATGKPDPNAQNPANGGRPLHLIAQLPFDDARALGDALISAGADVNGRDMDGRAPLMLACSAGDPSDYPLLLASSGADPRLCQLFLEWGADPNSFDRAGNTSLSYALAFDQPHMLAALLAAGADPLFPNAQGVSFLRACASPIASEAAVAAWALSAPAQAGDLPLDSLLEGFTALDTAVSSGNLPMARWLIQSGANPLAGQLEQSVADALAEGHRESAHLALEALQKAQFASPARPARPPAPGRSASA